MPKGKHLLLAFGLLTAAVLVSVGSCLLLRRAENTFLQNRASEMMMDGLRRVCTDLESDPPPQTHRTARRMVELLEQCYDTNNTFAITRPDLVRELTMRRERALSNVVAGLQKLSGQSFGRDLQAWQEWLKTQEQAVEQRGAVTGDSAQVALAAVTGASAPEAESEAVQKDLAQLQGEWSIVSLSVSGQAMTGKLVALTRQVYRGDEATTTMGRYPRFREKITIDPSRKPKTIDYEMIDKATKPMKSLGIYELDGDRFKLCLAPPGAERPTDSSCKLGERRSSSVLKREKPAGPARDSK
jgi:uncharacterized protein (TIGR03067 family)